MAAATTEAALRVEEGERLTSTPGGRGQSGSKATPWLFLAPYLVLFLAFVVAPAVYGFWISLHDYDYTLPGKPWVGLDNYRALFDSRRWRSTGSGTACARRPSSPSSACRCCWWSRSRWRW